MKHPKKPVTVDLPEKRRDYIGYARVSTDDQDLGMQRVALQRVGCWNVYEEKASGVSKRRYQLMLAKKDLQPGDTFFVWRLDRLGRDLGELIEWMKYFSDEGITFVSLTESIDTRTAAGKLVLHIFGAMAEFERNLTRERTQAGLKYAKDVKGMKLGAKPKITPAKRAAIAADLARTDMSVADVSKKHKIGTSTIYYLFPGGRHKMLLKKVKAKGTRKIVKAAMRAVETIWSRNGAASQ